MDKKQIIRDFFGVARMHRLNPVYLKEIAYLRTRGLDNTLIAKQAGFNRNTVCKYVKSLRFMDKDEINIILRRLLVD